MKVRSRARDHVGCCALVLAFRARRWSGGLEVWREPWGRPAGLGSAPQRRTWHIAVPFRLHDVAFLGSATLGAAPVRPPPSLASKHGSSGTGKWGESFRRNSNRLLRMMTEHIPTIKVSGGARRGRASCGAACSEQWAAGSGRRADGVRWCTEGVGRRTADGGRQRGTGKRARETTGSGDRYCIVRRSALCPVLYVNELPRRKLSFRDEFEASLRRKSHSCVMATVLADAGRNIREISGARLVSAPSCRTAWPVEAFTELAECRGTHHSAPRSTRRALRTP